MTWVSRRALTALLGVFTLSTVVAACSSSSATDAVGTSGQGEAFLAIDTTATPFVYVENLTDQPLVDVNVTLKSGMLTFSDSISRLEVKEKRQVRHGDFTSRDGTSFNLRITRPREVIVTARNLDGKQMETTFPWR